MKYLNPEQMSEVFRERTNKFRDLTEAAEHFGIKAHEVSRFRNYGSNKANLPQHAARLLGYTRRTIYVMTEQEQVPTADDYFIGQRVLLNRSEIGTIVKSATGDTQGIWVYSPANGYASDYAVHNIRPLPNGEL